MRRFVELQCDGLVGPTHNYAGLSHGNLASVANAASIAYPRQAALQGLQKMRLVHALGIPQLVMPPHPRPNLELLAALGFSGSVQEMLASAALVSPKILQAAWSASGMWAANMATISPAPDTADGALHITPANLAATLHRQQEAAFAEKLMRRIFGQVAVVHPPLPASVPLTDEGAANHLRLCAGHGEQGVEVFVYGAGSAVFPARQEQAASAAIGRAHQVKQALYVQQSPEAIDAGVFHNDVIAMSNERLLIYHEKAFAEEAAFIEQLRAALPQVQVVRISEAELPLTQAVASYFFNSQLLTLPEGQMVVLAPQESAEIPQARAVFDRLVADAAIPINEVHYLNLRESMRNGGGPACLRLRVVLRDEALAALPRGVIYSPQLHERLEGFIERHYPPQMAPDDLKDAAVAKHCMTLLPKLASILGLPELYTVPRL